MEDTSFKDMLSQSSHHLNKEEFEVLLVTTHQIWKRRNFYVFEGEFLSLSKPVQKSYQASEESRKVVSNSSMRVFESAVTELKWTPPPHNTYKINWDVAIDKTHSRVGIGVIVRD